VVLRQNVLEIIVPATSFGKLSDSIITFTLDKESFRMIGVSEVIATSIFSVVQVEQNFRTVFG
jgi:hypothetical protein